MRRLTDKQEAFCQHYAIHLKQADAYRFAYPDQKMKPNSIHSEVHKMMQNPVITLRIYELQTDVREAFKVSAKKKKHWLNTIIEASIQYKELADGTKVPMGDFPTAIKAIAELNKMDGDLAAQKKEITGKNGHPIESRAMTKEEYKQTREEMLKTDDC